MPVLKEMPNPTSGSDMNVYDPLYIQADLYTNTGE